jgi:glycosyltransferase involved in cell wall biosynthesis
LIELPKSTNHEFHNPLFFQNCPTIGILIPVKNATQYLERSLEDIKSQTIVPNEIIVVDDNSTDDTFFLAKELLGDSSNAIVLRNPGVGVVDALNFGLSISSSEWIARFDGDDRYDERRLETQLSFITPNSVAIFSDYTFFSDCCTNLGTIPTAVFNHATKLSLTSGYRSPHPAVLFRSSTVQDIGGYRKNYPLAEDLDLWLRIQDCGDFASSPSSLLSYRLSSSSSSIRGRAISKVSLKQLSLQYSLKSLRFSIQDFDRTLELYNLTEHSELRSMFHVMDILRVGRSLTFLPSNLVAIAKTSSFKLFLKMFLERQIRMLHRTESTRSLRALHVLQSRNGN